MELRKRLIDKIQKTENANLLAEAYRMLELDSQDIEIYNFTETQIKTIDEARQQIQKGQFLTNDQSNKEIDEWLKK